MILISAGNKPAVYTVENGVFKISSMYGRSVPFSDIVGVELKDTLPAHLTRTNGNFVWTAAPQPYDAIISRQRRVYKTQLIRAEILIKNKESPPVKAGLRFFSVIPDGR